MKRDMLELSFSCGEDFESMERRGAARHCASCDHAVHDLSSMTEREAAAFLAQHEDEVPCVRYRCDEDGQPLFMPEPSRRLRLLRQIDGVQRVAAAALLAAPLLLTACDEEPVGHAQAQAPLILRDGQPITLRPGAASAPAAPLSAEEQELARWRGELRAKQEARDTWRAQLAARLRAEQEAQAIEDKEQRAAQAVASYRGDVMLTGRLDRAARLRKVSKAHVQAIMIETGER